jgi:hypothetical protein
MATGNIRPVPWNASIPLLKLETYLILKPQWQNTATPDYGKLRNLYHIPFSTFPHSVEKTMIECYAAVWSTYSLLNLHRWSWKRKTYGNFLMEKC